MDKWGYVLIAAGVLCILGGILIKSYGSSQFDAGKTAQQLIYAKARAAAKEEAEKNVRSIQAHYDDVLREIRAQDDGGCVRPLIVRTVNSMPDPVSGQ